MSTALAFSKNLIKGRIAEVVFEQMFRSVKKFTVIPFGYERIIPEIARVQDRTTDSQTMGILRSAPDFALIDQDTRDVKLIEVKYRRKLDPQDILAVAKKIKASWNPSYLFLATLNGFYFDEVGVIIANNGAVQILPEEIIPKDTQKEYLQLLEDFEQDN